MLIVSQPDNFINHLLIHTRMPMPALNITIRYPSFITTESKKRLT